MKKIGKVLSVLIFIFGIFTMMGTNGCKKVEDKGTLILDNYTLEYLNISWKGGSYVVESLGYASYEVKSGSGTLTAYYLDGSVFASGNFTVPANGSLTIYLYYTKSGEIILTSEKIIGISKKIE